MTQTGASEPAAAPSSDPAAPLTPLAPLALVAAFLLPLAGIVIGSLALARVRRTGERGRSLALAGTVLSYLFTIAGIVAIVVYLTQLASLAGL